MRLREAAAVLLAVAGCTSTVLGTGAAPRETEAAEDQRDDAGPPVDAAADQTPSPSSGDAGVDAGRTVDLTGRWTGTSGTEALYLDLVQTGTAIRGLACEHPGNGCSTLEDGAIVAGVMRATVRQITSQGPAHWEFELTISPDGRMLTGAVTSSTCGCNYTTALLKL
jgi:hypothetical protein